MTAQQRSYDEEVALSEEQSKLVDDAPVGSDAVIGGDWPLLSREPPE